MHQNLNSIAAATATQPLTPTEAVTDDALRLLAKGEPSWTQAIISEQFSAMLVMSLPDICEELLAYRTAARLEAALPYPDPRNHSEEIANACFEHGERHPATNIAE